MSSKPRLKSQHKQVRIDCARMYIFYGDKWQTVLFSNEKIWNMDGRNGRNCYRQDLRKQPQGGKSLIAWGPIGFNTQISMAFHHGKQNFTTLSRDTIDTSTFLWGYLKS